MGKWTRRSVLGGVAGAGVGSAFAAFGGGSDGNQQSLHGGTMALDQAFNVAGDLWIGPDSAKGTVDATSGRVYTAVDTQLEYYGDGEEWVKMGIGSADAPVPEAYAESVSTEETDSDSYHSAFTLSFKPQTHFPRQDHPRFNWDVGRADNQIVNPERGRVAVINHHIYRAAGDSNERAAIWATQEGGGGIELIAEPHSDLSSFTNVQTTLRSDEWLLLDSGTMHAFGSPADIESNTTLATQPTHGVQDFAMVDWFDAWDTHGIMWADYTNDNVPEVSVYKYTVGGTFSEVLTLDGRGGDGTNEYQTRHFHNCDEDMFNRGTWYASTGDNDAEIHVFKSIDQGDTWDRIAGGEQKFRTLRVTPTEDYLYWGMDFKPGTLWRAERGNYANPEEVFTPDGDLYCYGTAYCFNPEGILIAYRDPELSWLDDGIPMYFHDLETGETRELYRWQPVDNASNPGISGMGAYQNQMTGYVPLKVSDIKTNDTTFSNNAEVRVDRVQG